MVFGGVFVLMMFLDGHEVGFSRTCSCEYVDDGKRFVMS